MSLFRRFSQVRRLVASPQKSGAPNLRLFQPYLRRRQTSLSQPCSKLTGVVFRGSYRYPGVLLLMMGEEMWRVILSKSKYNLHRIQACQLLCCFAVVLEMPAHKYELGRKETIHQMSLFKQFNRCHRFVASPHKSGEPSLRLFQPYLRRRQTLLSQPCSN